MEYRGYTLQERQSPEVVVDEESGEALTHRTPGFGDTFVRVSRDPEGVDQVGDFKNAADAQSWIDCEIDEPEG